MTLSSRAKHGIHVCCFIGFILFFELITGGLRVRHTPMDDIDPVARYGILATVIIYALRVVSLLIVPQCICNMLGLTMYNAFVDKISLKGSPLLAPFVCVRVVTRGYYPNLVKSNVERNIAVCRAVGMENFMVEVVTDQRINLPSNPRTREVVVPEAYTTKSGALFKARALQYCLEDDVNILREEDWIVHLDEETIMTENCVKGILNFCMDGQHQFGQGLVTYANETIVNWITTLADTFRVADDMGKLRFQLRYFHKPLFGWKGSYVVTQVAAERKVSYDHGPDGSVAEDCYFALIASQMGYSFDFIEGEMWEKSPFSFWDFLQQRKRWLQGIFLTVHSGKISCRTKLLLSFSLYAWASIPFTTWNAVLAAVTPVPGHWLVDFLCAYVGAVSLYMYIFGVIRSFTARYRHKPWKLILYSIGALATIPFNIWIENIAVMWGMLGAKHNFYIVQKETEILQV